MKRAEIEYTKDNVITYDLRNSESPQVVFSAIFHDTNKNIYIYIIIIIIYLYTAFPHLGTVFKLFVGLENQLIFNFGEKQLQTM